jgi:hypothetical protein
MPPHVSSLSGDVLYQSLRDQFKGFTDARNPSRVKIPIEDFLMSALATFALKFPSLLQFEEEMGKERAFSNLKGLFGVTAVPSDTHMRSVLDEVDTEQFRKLFASLFHRAQRAKVLSNFEIFPSTYCLAIDGTGYFYSDKVHCAQCLTKKQSHTDELAYYHQMLCGALVHPTQKTVIPFNPEPISRQDGMNKNDCEQNAMKRFLIKFREDHPRLKTIILTDALHATLPLLDLLEKLELGFVLAVKPGSHSKLFEGLDKKETFNQVYHFEEEEQIGDKVKKQRIKHYRFCNGVLLNHSGTNRSVNFLEFWETTQWVDSKGRLQQQKKHFSWVTDYSLYTSSCKQIVAAGRSRWKIENETFNTLKNQGYEFEHNFGHGYKNLANNFSALMLLAFFVDQLQEMRCPLFQSCLSKVFGKRSRLWLKLKAIYSFFPIEFTSFTEFLSFFHDPTPWVRQRDSS